MHVNKAVLFLIIILLLLYLPFVNKAVHIDDGNFIQMAKAIRFPFSVEPGTVYYFMGTKTENFNPFNSTHPPFIPWYLSFLGAAFRGYAEPLLHAGYLIFPIILMLASWHLARELRIEPLPAVLAISGNVALLPVSHTLMADAPMFSLLVLSAYLFLSGTSRNSFARVILACIVLTISGLMAYQAFLFLPAFFIYAFVQRRLNSTMLLGLGLPVFVMLITLIWTGGNIISSLSGVAGEVQRGLGADRMFNKGMSIPVMLGISVLFLLPLKVRDIRAARRYPVAAALCLLIVVPPVMSLSYPLLEAAVLAALAAVGLFTIFCVVSVMRRQDWSGAERLFLLAWGATVLAYNIFLMPFGAMRYLIPLIVPTIFIFMKHEKSMKRLMVSAVCTALLGLAVAYGDYLYASSYRDFSREVGRTVGEARERVWYVGEWGMHHYMDREGFNYLTSDSTEPKAGDLIIFADIPRLWNLSPELYKRIRLLDVREVKTLYPVRVMGADIRAGYYSALWGYLPFSVSNHPLERFGIFRVIS